MANNILTQGFDYTYNGIESTEIFIKPAIMHPDTLSLFRVESGIKYKKQLNLLNPYGKVFQGPQGCGTPVVTGQGLTVTNRTLEVKELELYLEQCGDVFQGTILDELTRSGVAHKDWTSGQVASLIQGLVSEAMARDFFRIFSFGDTTSPAGDPSYYGMVDGLWTTLFAGISGYEVTAVNPSVSTLNQTAGTRAIDYFQALWTGAPNLLKQASPNLKKFYVTYNVFENYIINLQNVQTANGGFTTTTENGQMRAFYQGIEVVPVMAWDQWISADNLGTNVRILYTTTDNHVVGIEEASNQGDMLFWYDPNTNLNKIRGRCKLGYQYVHSDLQAISYGNV
jgi:hypothetical protein